MPKTSARDPELVILTGLSGSGKGSVLKSLEDLGYYAVDHLPIELIPKFAELIGESKTVRSAALVVDIREGENLLQFPRMYARLKRRCRTRLIFLEASETVIARRFSETRRPHPLGLKRSLTGAVRGEKRLLAPIRALADLVIDTSKFNVHELRELIGETFSSSRDETKIAVYMMSFGYRDGIPADADLVFDVRFLPNPNYVAKLRKFTGRHPSVARFIRSFPQTVEFLERITALLVYLLPHYIREGKSYLTIAFGCTGGHHRSVMIADQVAKNLTGAGFRVKTSHRDLLKPL